MVVRSAFLLTTVFNRNTSRSGRSTNGTVLPTQTFFGKKRNTFRRIPLFSFFSEMTEVYHALWSDTRFIPTIANGKNRFICFPDGTTVFAIQMESARELYCFHLAENSHRFFHTNDKRSRMTKEQRNKRGTFSS